MKKTLPSIILLVFFALCGTSIQAVTKYWDIDGATAGAGGATPVGTWDAGTFANWTTDSTGASVGTTFGDNDDAVFSAGSNASGTFTINLGGTPIVGNLTNEEGTITISGGTALNIGGGVTLKGNIDVLPNSKLTISSVVTGGDDFGGITKGISGGTGTGTLVLNGLNTYTGQTTVRVGTLSFDSIGNVGGGASALGNPADATLGAIKLGGGTVGAILKYTGTGHSTDRVINLATSTGATIIDASGSGVLVFTGATGVSVGVNGIKKLMLAGTNTAENKITGTIVDSGNGNRTTLEKNDSGTWVLTGNNTFSGVCDIRDGTLIVHTLANAGTSSSIGTANAGAAHAVIGLGAFGSTNATLKYIGSGHSCNRKFTMWGTTTNAVGGTIDASGTGPLVLSGDITHTGQAESFDKVLTLKGDNTGNNTIGGIIYDGLAVGGSKTLIKKQGAGKWILSGANSNSGPTIVSEGTLMGNVGGSCVNSAVTVETATTATLGVSITDNTKQWTCKSLTYSVAGGLTFAFGTAIVPSVSTAPLKVNGDPAFTATPTVTITHNAIPSTTATYPLVSYTGTASGTAPTTVTLTPTLTGGATASLQLDTVNKVLNLVITGTAGASELNWGTPGNGNWDIGNSGNTVWKDSTTHASTYYRETVTPGDKVIFEDTDSGGGNHVITMLTTVRPTSVTVNSANAYTIATSGSGVIAGSVGLTKLGTGTLTLNAANTYSGDTRIAAGKLVLANSSALTNSTLDLGDGNLSFGYFTAVTLGGLKGTNNLMLLNDSSAAVALSIGKNNGNTSYRGVLSGAGSFTKTGTGTFTWGDASGATHTYNGNTTISQGTVVLSKSDVLPYGGGNGNLTVDGILTMSGTNVNLHVNGLSGTGTINTSSYSGTAPGPTIYVGENNVSSGFAGKILKTPGNQHNSLVKVGTGTLTMSNGNAIGGTTDCGFFINAGKVIAVTASGACGGWGITVNDPTGTGSATMEIVSMTIDPLNGGGLTLGTNATLTCSGGGGIFTRSSSASAAGPTILNYAQVTLSTATAGDTLTLGSVVSGGNASSLITVAGPGPIVLNSGSATGFNGKWRLSGGTLRLGNENSLGNSVTKAIELAGGTLETQVKSNQTFSTATTVSASTTITPNQAGFGADHNFGTLAINNSTLRISPGSQVANDTTETVTFNTTTLTGDATFDIANNGIRGMRVILGAVGETGGAWRLTKAGNGTLTLSDVNTYTGPTTVSDGTLLVNSPGSLAAASVVTVASGATLGGDGTINGLISVLAGGHLLPGASSGTLTLAGNLVFAATADSTFELSSSTSSGNDKVVLTGTSATLDGAASTIRITPLATLATADYVLFDLTGSSGHVIGNFATSPGWTGTPPGNASEYTIITSGKQVLLHWTSPCVTPTAYSVTGGGAYCSSGSGVAIGLANSESGVTYQLYRNGGVTSVGTPVAADPGNPITFGNQTLADTYTVVANRTSGGCTANMTGSATVTVNALPTITLGTNPAVCSGTTSAALTYSATTATPDQYSIDFDSAANTAGFVDVTLANLPASPITISVPAVAAAATYSGTLTMKNSTNGCVSAGSAITVMVNAATVISNQPTNLKVCAVSPAVFTVGATGTALTYQWQVSGDGGTTFTNISGAATNASYTNLVTMLADSLNQYQVIVSGTCGSALTSAPPALLTVSVPVLSIVPQGKDVIIFWPVACISYVLEEKADLNPLTTWTPVTAAVIPIGNQNTVTVPVGSTNEFFRLRYP